MSHKPQEFTVQPDTLKIKLRNVVDYSFEPASGSETEESAQCHTQQAKES